MAFSLHVNECQFARDKTLKIQFAKKSIRNTFVGFMFFMNDFTFIYLCKNIDHLVVKSKAIVNKSKVIS